MLRGNIANLLWGWKYVVEGALTTVEAACLFHDTGMDVSSLRYLFSSTSTQGLYLYGDARVCRYNPDKKQWAM